MIDQLCDCGWDSLIEVQLAWWLAADRYIKKLNLADQMEVARDLATGIGDVTEVRVAMLWRKIQT